MATALSIEQSKQLRAAVTGLVVKSEAQAALLSDDAGNVVAEAGMGQGENVQTIAALGAGSFAATREMAVMIGEPAFQSIFLQGVNANIYVRSVGASFCLMVLFRRKTAGGLVKLYADRLSEEVKPLLHALDGQSPLAAGGTGVRFEMDPSALPLAPAAATPPAAG